MKRVIHFTYGLLFLFILGCANGEKKIEEVTNKNEDYILVSHQQFENAGMELGSIKTHPFHEMVKVSGMIDVPPENKAVVSPTIGGYIKEIPLLVGDYVKKGQALVVIENPEFVKMQQEYLEAAEQLKYLESEFERQRILFDEKISSKKSFLKTESDFKITKARYNGLKKQLEMLNIPTPAIEEGQIFTTSTIYSPISGSITKVNISKGAYVSPATAIIEIIDNSHIHLELSVFEKDILKIKKGQPIRFKIPESSEDTFQAEVYLVGTSINENRSIKVHGHLIDTSDQNFLTGMFVEASILTAKKELSALERGAIVLQDGKYYALRLAKEDDGGYYLEQIEIIPNANSDNFTGISNVAQFNKADKFLIKGAFNLITE